MARTAKVTIDVAGVSQAEAALAEGARAIRELAALREAITRHRADAEGLLEGIETGAVMADVEGLARAKVEADVWDEVAALAVPGDAASSWRA